MVDLREIAGCERAERQVEKLRADPVDRLGYVPSTLQPDDRVQRGLVKLLLETRLDVSADRMVNTEGPLVNFPTVFRIRGTGDTGMALEIVEMLSKLVSAQSEQKYAEKLVDGNRMKVRKALEKMISRCQKILDAGDVYPEHGYEVAFLDDALADINEADRRYEVDYSRRTHARNQVDLINGIVEGLKENVA